MAEARKKYPKVNSPKLTFKFPKITDPDYGSKEYPKPDGEYSLKGIAKADDPQIKAFIAKLQPIYDEAMADAEAKFAELKVDTRKKLKQVTRNPLFTTVYDQETEEETGEIEFKFAMKASGDYKKGPKAGQKWHRKPDVFDAKGMPMKKVPAIWGGTVGKVSFEASPYFIPGTGVAGLKLALNGVQVIDLVSGGQRTASSHGFGEEDGYAHDEDVSEDEAAGQFSNETGSSETPEADDNADF